MCYKNTDLNSRGRPVIGAEKRCVTRNVRLEPYIDKKLAAICKVLGVTKSEAIRQGIFMYLEAMDKLIKEKGVTHYGEHEF